jgi:hypothetical protein
MTDADRLLKYMRNGGEVCPTDWNDRNTPDGDKTILRVAARVLDLKNAGHDVRRVGTKNRCAVYRWFCHEPVSQAA